MPTTPAFENAYKRLNTSQKAAVDAIDGPVMVVAGPGTGKTQILALRIANILLQTDTAPTSILALTFTESGVFSMRKRLLDIIGISAHKINIYTFHGFCNDIIKRYPESFPRIIGAENATEIDQIKIFEDILSEASLDYLKPYGDPLYYLRSIMGAIRNLKRENISSKKFKEIVEAQEKEFGDIPEEEKIHSKGAHKGKVKGEFADLLKKIEKNKELVQLFAQYEKALEKKKLYDYEDMIVEVVAALSTNADLLLQLQEEYQYILADEHQDANGAQNKILELLSNFHSEPNLFIVGDEKQAIFRFQGASLENFLYFRKLYPQAKIISLTENYRSTQTILDSAHTVIAHNKTDDAELRKELKAQKESEKENKKINIREFSTVEVETAWIAQNIKEKIETGVNPNEIAVIYRDNRDAVPLMREFEKKSVPFLMQSDQNIFDDEDIKKFIIILRAITNLGNPQYIIELLYIDFLKIEPLDVYKVITCAYKQKISIFDALDSEECLREARVKDPEKLHLLSQKLSSWTTVAKNKTVLESFEILLNETGLLAHIMSSNEREEKLARIDNFFKEAQKILEHDPSARLENLVEYIDILSMYNILIKVGAVGNERSGVRLMTAHRSKGLEFEHVYIVGLTDGHWGNKREIRHFHIPLKGFQSTGFDPMEDERRLFYVALTRAKHALNLSFSRIGLRGEALLPAQFISEFNIGKIDMISEVEFEKKYETEREKKYAPRKIEVKKTDKLFLQELFLSQGLSITALNKFLNCPWDYFFNNLLHVPSAQSKHQLYGTAIHDTLRTFFDAYRQEKDYSKAEFLKIFERNLSSKSLQEIDFKESLKKGKDALGGYYDTYKDSWKRNLMTEYGISGVPFSFTALGREQTISLRGILDKIEMSGDSDVEVIDYKTAKPRTRNAIMGKTKSDSGDYFRQLMFYKLLLEKSEPKKYRLKTAAIDFIEPDEKGNYHREIFEADELNMAELTEKITEVATSIYTFDFWDKRCDDKDCKWCALRTMMKDTE